ncbi:hypothetical protein [Mesorhizobium sp.]|nr:hypothetical protein [Mesorhizobium sp.]
MPNAQGKFDAPGKPLILLEEINRACGRRIIDRFGAFPYVLGLA